jgi:CheY-like chemotaxis protein
VARAILAHGGHTVVVAENGGQAVDCFLQERFDLILMDVQMPEMSGFEATAAIRTYEYEHGGHIPIVALTAHAMQGDREKCREAGMDDYVSKPVTKQAVLDVVEKLTAGAEPPPVALAG